MLISICLSGASFCLDGAFLGFKYPLSSAQQLFIFAVWCCSCESDIKEQRVLKQVPVCTLALFISLTICDRSVQDQIICCHQITTKQRALRPTAMK